MATVTGYTAARMKQIEDATVIGGHVNENGDLILERFDGQYLTGGHVAGSDGAPGTQGPPGVADQEVLDDIYENINDNKDKIEEVTLTPKAPTNLILVQNSASFQSDGRVQCQVYLMWDLVVSSVDDKPIGPVEYQIWARTGTEAAKPIASGNRDAEIVITSWPPALTSQVSVRAKSIYGTVWSDLSEELTVTTIVPPQSPDITVAPTLTTNLGLVFVNWNGDFFDASKPNGFQHVLVEYEISGSGDWQSVGIPVTNEGQVATIRETTGEDVSVRLRWVDTLGRISDPSASASITVLGVGHADISAEIMEAIDQAEAKADQALSSLLSTVKSVIIEYALASSETVAPTTGWSTDAPARTAGTFIWTRTITTYVDDTSDTSSPALMTGNTGAPGTPGTPGADGQDGAPGAPGKGALTTTTTYQVGSSGTVAPTGTWQSTPQATSVGQFLWTRTVTTWSDSTNTTSYSVAAHGATGSTGAPGTPGKGLSSSAITYQVSSSGTTAPTGTWLSSVPTVPEGQFLWTRTLLTWTDSTTSTAYSVAKQGSDGAVGSPGKGVSSTAITYQASASGTTAPTGTWSGTIPSVPAGQFLWTRTIITYTDSTTSTIYSIGKSGVDGSNGAPGTPGEDGQTSYLHTAYSTAADGSTGFSTTDPTGKTYLGTYTDFTAADSTTPGDYVWVKIQGPQGNTGNTGPTGKGISSSDVAYQKSSSGTVTPTGTWTLSVPTVAAGEYLWTRTTITFTDGATQVSYSVARTGTNGSTGATGVGVSSVTPYFLTVGAGSAVPAKPTANPPGGSWSLTEPGYVSSTDLYRTELIVYTNSTFAYTNVTKVSAYTAATQAVTVANLADAAAKGMVKASATDPGHQLGRIWLVLDGSGKVVGIQISNGSAWTSYTMMADQILVPSSVGTVSIAQGAVTASKVSIVDFQNYFKDPTWTDPGFTWSPWTVVPGVGIQKSGTGTQHGAYYAPAQFVVKPGEKYQFKATRTDIEGSTGEASVYLQQYDAAGALQGTTEVLEFLTAGTKTGIYEVPNGISSVRIGFYTQTNMPSTTKVQFSDVEIRRMVGTLIEPGSVTTEKLDATEIWANEAWLNVLRAGVIEVDMVVSGFGENLDIGSNSMINLIIDGQADNTANIGLAQDSADAAAQAATDANNAAAAAQGAADTVQGNLDVTNGLVQSNIDEVDNLKTWFRVDSAGAHMGRTDSAFQTHMYPDRFAITDNGVETTYWKSGVMNVASAEVTNIILSNHQISPFDNGGTVIRAVGV